MYTHTDTHTRMICSVKWRLTLIAVLTWRAV